MRNRYSAWNLLAAARGGHRDWAPAWRDAEPKARYDVLVIGGGGHGLATAYYLAKNHGVTNVAVLEAGWIGGGNTGRNTTIVRSNYLYPESARLYEFGLKLYETLARDLNFNIMLSQRGVLTLAHSRHDLDAHSRWANAMLCNGIDVELLSRDQVHALEPRLNVSASARFPIVGGIIQRRGGTARHDAVAWSFARGASALGVDIVQNCAVTGFVMDAGRVTGVHARRSGAAAGGVAAGGAAAGGAAASGVAAGGAGHALARIEIEIRADKVALAVAGHSSVLAQMAGVRLPVTSYALQAMVTEPVKPVLDTVTMSPALAAYWSQSDKGEIVFGGVLDHFPSYAQRGSFATASQAIAATCEMLPTLARLRLMRQWAGIVDIVHDSSPIIGATPVPGLYVNCGWGTGGFKAIPVGGWTLAHLLATGRNHELAEPFQLERFVTGRLIDEAAASGIEH